MFSKIKGMFSSCRSNHYVALSNETPVTVKNRRTSTKTDTQANIEIPKSIFDFQAPNSHRAVILDNQDLFKSIQNDVIRIIDDYMKDMKDTPEHKSIKENLHKKRQIYVIDDFIQTESQKQIMIKKTQDIFEGLVVQLDTQLENNMSLMLASGLPVLQIGTNPSHILHKDNGIHHSSSRKEILEFDYTIVIPVVDYDLSGNQNHNFFPQSTKILPMEFKHLVPEYDKKKENRKTVFYVKLDKTKQEEIKQHLVSEPLQQGTAIILHTVTAKNSDDDGQSVIHQTPETPDDFVRCFILERANKVK